MTRIPGAALISRLPVEDYAVLDEILSNGSTSRKQPRRFLTCRRCGRRTRNINRHPLDANGWRVVPRSMTACPECLEQEPDETKLEPCQAKARYQNKVKQIGRKA